MGKATIFDGDLIKALKENLNLNDEAYILSGTDDPSAVAKDAPKGSLYMRTGVSGAELYQKADNGLTTNWIRISITGATNRFAGFDNLGNLHAIPNWNIETISGGSAVSLSVTPANPGSPEGRIFFDHTLTITPTEDAPNLNYTGDRVYFDIGSTFDLNSTTGRETRINTFDLGNKGNITNDVKGISLGDGTNASESNYVNGISNYIIANELHTVVAGLEGINSGIELEATSEAEYINGLSLNMTIDGNIVNNMNYMVMYGQFNSSLASGVSGVSFNPTFLNDVDFVNGISVNPNFDSGTDVANGAVAFTDATQIKSGASLNSYTSLNLAPNFITGSSITQNYTGLNISPNIFSTMSPTSGVNLAVLNGNFASSMQYWNGLGVGGSVQGTAAITNGIQPLYISTNVEDAVTAGYFTGFGIFGTLESGTTIGNYTAINVNPVFDGTISTDLTLLGLYGSGTGSSPQVRGVSVSVTNISSPNQKVAIESSGGKLNITSPVNTGDFSVIAATQGNYISTDFTIASGSPISGGEFVFGQLINSNIVFNDDMGTDVLGGLLGFSSNAFVGQIVSTATKTIDNVNMLVAAGNLVSQTGDGGAITNLNLYRAIGVLPSGGATFITNMYAFRADGLLSAASPANLWGISIEDANAENFFEKSIAIGTATKKVTNADIALEIESLKAIRFARLTSAQRTALTALDGMMIFNTDTSTMEYYDGTNWIAF